eukprot:scaffold8486_cov267-Pinguiococcus_pyrenoidosus.AAC.3
MLPPTPTVPISSPAEKPRGSAKTSNGALVSMLTRCGRCGAERRKREELGRHALIGCWETKAFIQTSCVSAGENE